MQQNSFSEERSRSARPGALRVSCRNGVAAGVPDVLVDGGRAADLRGQPHAVEEAGEMGERRCHVDDAVPGDPQPLRQRGVRRDQGVVRVHDALGLTRRARREDHQRHVVRVGP